MHGINASVVIHIQKLFDKSTQLLLHSFHKLCFGSLGSG